MSAFWTSVLGYLVEQIGGMEVRAVAGVLAE